MANRQERRAAEAKARKQYNKDELMQNWRKTQAEAMQLKQMYREAIMETEQLRQKSIQVQFALLCTLWAAGGEVRIPNDLMEEVEAGAIEGWRSFDDGDSVVLEAVFAESNEDDAE